MERTQRIEVRVSPAERELIETRAATAGVKVSEYVRQVALGVAPLAEAVNDGLNQDALSVKRPHEETARAQKASVEPRRVSPPERVDEATGKADAPQGPSERFHCPMPHCNFSAPSKAARCPTHARTVR